MIGHRQMEMLRHPIYKITVYSNIELQCKISKSHFNTSEDINNYIVFISKQGKMKPW